MADVATVVADERGFETVDATGRGRTRVEWADVARVEAYKVDLLTIDDVCVDFVLDDGGRIRITEELEGWNACIAEAERQLTGMTLFDEWWGRVVPPAFAENREVLFERSRAATIPD